MVKDCSKVVTYDDPIILNITRSKKVETSVLAGYVINLEKELSTSISVGAALVQSTQFEDVHTSTTEEQRENLLEQVMVEQRENQQSSKFLDMHIVGPWSVP